MAVSKVRSQWVAVSKKRGQWVGVSKMRRQWVGVSKKRRQWVGVSKKRGQWVGVSKKRGQWMVLPQSEASSGESPQLMVLRRELTFSGPGISIPALSPVSLATTCCCPLSLPLLSRHKGDTAAVSPFRADQAVPNEERVCTTPTLIALH